jgi:hypothetical protein
MRAFHASLSINSEPPMEAEQLNALANQLDDLDLRSKELRRYL